MALIDGREEAIMSESGLMPVLKPVLWVECLFVCALFLSAKFGFGFAAGMFLILTVLGLMLILWLIGTYLMYSGAKDIWKDLNS